MLNYIANENNKGVCAKKTPAIAISINSKMKINKYNLVANLDGLHS